MSSRSRVSFEWEEERRTNTLVAWYPLWLKQRWKESSEGVRKPASLEEWEREGRKLELTVLSGGGLVRLGGDGEVDSNFSALEILSRDVVDASLSILDASHGHKPEASRSVGLRGRVEGRSKAKSQLALLPSLPSDSLSSFAPPSIEIRVRDALTRWS